MSPLDRPLRGRPKGLRRCAAWAGTHPSPKHRLSASASCALLVAPRGSGPATEPGSPQPSMPRGKTVAGLRPHLAFTARSRRAFGSSDCTPFMSSAAPPRKTPAWGPSFALVSVRFRAAPMGRASAHSTRRLTRFVDPAWPPGRPPSGAHEFGRCGSTDRRTFLISASTSRGPSTVLREYPARLWRQPDSLRFGRCGAPSNLRTLRAELPKSPVRQPRNWCCTPCWPRALLAACEVGATCRTSCWCCSLHPTEGMRA